MNASTATSLTALTMILPIRPRAPKAGCQLPLVYRSPALSGRASRNRVGGESFTGRARPQRSEAMPNPDPNDTRLITPLLLMGLIVVCGLLYFAYLGHA